MSVLKLPTAEKGIFLRHVTELEDKAWFLTNRPFGYPATPDKPDAPDHRAYLKQRSMWANAPEGQVAMGIWDNHVRYNALIFAGYVTLSPSAIKGHEGEGEIGAQIAAKHQGLGYAKLGLAALIKYGQEELGYQRFVGDALASNTASRALCASLGFEEVTSYKKGHVTLIKQLPSE